MPTKNGRAQFNRSVKITTTDNSNNACATRTALCPPQVIVNNFITRVTFDILIENGTCDTLLYNREQVEGIFFKKIKTPSEIQAQK